MKWYQCEEQAAGHKRLLLTWYLYKFFGKRTVQIIAFFVSFFAFVFSKQIRKYTRKNLTVIFDFTKNKSAKPTILNQYRLVLNYALSLVDRMETFACKYDADKIVFEDEAEKESLLKILNQKKGVFFICSHIGNIEVMRTFISNPQNHTVTTNPHVNIFLSEEQCKIFNGFLKNIEKEIHKKINLTTFPVEQISIDTAILMHEKLGKGEIAFMAGDRISSGSSNLTFKTNFLNRQVEYPAGTFKFAQLCEQEIFFISAIKEKNDRYKIYMQKFKAEKHFSKAQNLEKIQTEYTKFLEKMTNTAPLQFYHFYDIFD